MATTLLRMIARRCIARYDLTLTHFRSREQMAEEGYYCSDRMADTLLKEALSRRPSTMGVCVWQASQDSDLEVAYRYLLFLAREGHEHDVREHLRYGFMVALAHEIKSELKEREEVTDTART